MPARNLFCFAALAVLTLCCVTIQAAEEPFPWQQDYARVTEKGDIEWTPRPFRFVSGGSVRFIDYESGSDAVDGASPQRPWKHHPWDTAATGSAAAAKGIETYVFKGGVIYRGQLSIKE